MPPALSLVRPLQRGGEPADADQAVSLVRHVQGLPNLSPYGLYTHLDVPDAPRAHEYIAWQLERYARVCVRLKQIGIQVPAKMVASSAVLRYTPDAAMDAVDPGHILFGQTPPGPVAVASTCGPRAGPSRAASSTRDGLTVESFVTSCRFRYATTCASESFPIGLRDGMASVACGSVLASGRRVPILGPISLEHTRVDLTGVPEARVGDEVVVVGQQGATAIRPEEVIAHHRLAVKPELAMAIRGSVQRVYR